MRIEYYSGATAGRGRYGLVTANDASGIRARDIGERNLEVFLQLGSETIQTGVHSIYRSGKPRFETNGNDDLHLQLCHNQGLPRPTRSLQRDTSINHPTQLVDGNFVLKSIDVSVAELTDDYVTFRVLTFSTCSNNYSTIVADDGRAVGMRNNELREWTPGEFNISVTVEPALISEDDEDIAALFGQIDVIGGSQSENTLEQNIPALPPALASDFSSVSTDSYVEIPESGRNEIIGVNRPSDRQQRTLVSGFVYIRILFTLDQSGNLSRIFPVFKHGRYQDTMNAERSRRSSGYTDVPPFDANNDLLLSEFISVAGPFSDCDLAEREFMNIISDRWPVFAGAGNQREWHRLEGSSISELVSELQEVVELLSEYAQGREVNFQDRLPWRTILNSFN